MKLTIATATYDDYDGVFFTLQSIKMHHGIEDVELLVMDNNPESAHGKPVGDFCRSAGAKYLPQSSNGGSWAKYHAFDHASGDIVMVIDCHILLYPGAMEAVVAYFTENPASLDMLQGPCVFDCLKAYGTSFQPEWRGHDFGVWHTDKDQFEKGVPFEIPMMGMGCFAMRKEAWPGVNRRLNGFGSEEWYVAEKVRRGGGRVLCHPALKWVHRWHRPAGVPYPCLIEDKIRNYAVGWTELYGVKSPQVKGMIEHFSTIIPRERVIAAMSK